MHLPTLLQVGTLYRLFKISLVIVMCLTIRLRRGESKKENEFRHYYILGYKITHTDRQTDRNTCILLKSGVRSSYRSSNVPIASSVSTFV